MFSDVKTSHFKTKVVRSKDISHSSSNADLPSIEADVLTPLFVTTGSGISSRPHTHHHYNSCFETG
jgi:hypothetical protein